MRVDQMTLTMEDARRIGAALGVEWEQAKFDPEEFRMGIAVELGHGRHLPADVTDEDELAAFNAALAHLAECPDYYSRAERREAELRAYSESL
jgi:hypothetical protein